MMKFAALLLLLYLSSIFCHSRRHDPMVKLLKQTYRGRQRMSYIKDEPLYLSKYIEENKLKEAKAAAAVDNTYLIPGLESYSGYLTVNKTYNSNIFFWYFPIRGKPVEDTPWIIWLQGGPGASSLYGLFEEVGPILVTEKGKLEEREYSWGKNYSLLFIDNPVGSGFSFTEDARGLCVNQTLIAENLYNALQQFLTIFPELRQAPLFIAGESYGGKHVPSLGIQIHWNKNKEQPINLKGLAIGNGWIDPENLQRYSYFGREVGLVDDNIADELKEEEDKVVELIENGDSEEARHKWGNLWGMFRFESDLVNAYNFLDDKGALNDLPYVEFVQQDHIRKAIHVGSNQFENINFTVYVVLLSDMMNSAKPWLEELLDNYKVLLYNGHLDTIIPYHASVHSYLTLDFDGAEEYQNATRTPWITPVDERLGGYIKTGGNLMEVMVRGAGHMVPKDQPRAALLLISRFIDDALGSSENIFD